MRGSFCVNGKIKTGYAHAEPVSHNTINQNLPPELLRVGFDITKVSPFFLTFYHTKTNYDKSCFK